LTDQPGTLSAALENGHKLLGVNPARAEIQAREILKVMPQQPMALLLLASARRAQGDNAGARAILDPLARTQLKVPAVHYEFGSVLANLGETRAAIAAFKHTTRLEPKNPAVWRTLGNLYTLAGDGEAADDAYAQGIKASVHDPELVTAATALCENRLAVAERLLRDFVKRNPTDVAAIRMLAETASRLAAYEDAENLLARALELAPSFTPARHNYAVVLHRQFKSEAALKQIDLLLEKDPGNPAYRTLRAAVLVRIGEYHEAIKCYEILLRDQPAIPKAWMSYAHALKTVGRQEDSIAAYRKSIALLPKLGESYWSLANLKTFRFGDSEIDAMRAQLARTDLADEDRYHLEFALGKALEDKSDFAQSFEHYEQGNSLRRKSQPYDVEATTTFTRESKALFTRTFFEERADRGSQAPDPIFIVGLPRAGSTLIEQILSSHSQIEGTMELPDLLAIARRLGGSKRKADLLTYLEALPSLDAKACATLGAEYLQRTNVQRKLAKPFFIDKMPNNFHHIGLIQLILPKAKIIDARRHPMGCCLSNFKQHYAHGQAFAYDLAETGRYYRDYVELMAHFDTVLPGRVHRAIHENMVANPERETRALLDYCGLPFEESCLRYYENDRAVRTASSEQVRQPIFTEGVEQWRNYEEWLAALKDALGPVLDAYPEVPVF
jgi:tetratricopeptide (TPR) repeat protein